MIYAYVALAGAVVGIGAMTLVFTAFVSHVLPDFERERKNLLAAAEVERSNWMSERRELLNRIQRPEIMQHVPVEDFPTPEVEQDDIGLVGAIEYDPDYEYDSALADALTQAAFDGNA